MGVGTIAGPSVIDQTGTFDSHGNLIKKNTGTTPLQQLRSYIGSASNAANAAVGAAQSGVNAVLGGQSVVNNAVSGMNQNAAMMNQTASAALATANEAKSKYDSLTPYANILNSNATDLWNRGTELSGNADNLYGMANSIFGMDASAGGLAGEYMKMYNYLSPDRYVSQAASDVQGSFQNAQGQAQRNLSRMGVSADSGAYVNLQKQYAQSLATALAAAKTRARQTGIDQQSAYLDKMLTAANSLYGTANSTEEKALANKAESNSATSSAAGIVGTQAQGYVSVGGLQVNAGGLFGESADVMGKAANLNNSYLNILNSAYGNLVTANNNAAGTYLDAARTEVSAFNGGVRTLGTSGSSSGSGKNTNNNNLTAEQIADAVKSALGNN